MYHIVILVETAADVLVTVEAHPFIGVLIKARRAVHAEATTGTAAIAGSTRVGPAPFLVRR